MAGIEVLYAHRMETLVADLADEIRDRIGDPAALFSPVDVIVPNPNLRKYLQLELARRLGVTPNLRFHLLRRFLADRLPTDGQWAKTSVVDHHELHHVLVDVLMAPDLDQYDGLEEVIDYLRIDDGTARERRCFQLAAQVARLFTEYSFSRSAPVFGPQSDEVPLLVRWRDIGDGGAAALKGVERWQQCLWWRIFGGNGELARLGQAEGKRYMMLADALGGLQPESLVGVPEQLHVVGFSYVARLFIEALGMLGQRADVRVRALSPCAGWTASGFDGEIDGEHLLIERWGTAGRDYAAMLADVAMSVEVIDADNGAAAEPETLLAAMQQDVAKAPNEPARAKDGHGGVRFFECPSIQREVEAVANEIWTLLRESNCERQSTGKKRRKWKLRPDEIAVVVAGADRAAYIAQIESVFGGFHGLPHNVLDVPASSDSRILEAVHLLLDLPFGRFTRRELLRLLVHPNMRGRGAEVDPQTWVRWCDRLGILYDADRDDQADTYLGASYEVAGQPDYEWDLYNWDQGMRRLTLGTFLSGKRSGVDRLFRVGRRDYEPEEVSAGDATVAARFTRLVSSLIADAKFLQGAEGAAPLKRPVDEWAEIVDAYLETYLVPTEEADQDAYTYVAARRVVQQVAEACPTEGEVTYRVFYEFVRQELEGLSKSKGQHLVGGVVVSSCLPMRAIPFKHVFVLGLGEGNFPNPEREDPLDLRYRDWQRGDLKPADRDRYTFLETLLSAREGLWMSWVAREATTGEALEPSSVVHELRQALHERFDVASHELTARHPLRRYDYQCFPKLAEALGADASPPPADPEDPHGERLLAVSSGLHPEARAEAKMSALRDRLAQADNDDRPRRMPTLDALRRMVRDAEAPDADALGAAWQTLREAMALEPLPSEQPRAEEGEAPAISVAMADGATAKPRRRIRLTLSQLRGFLESPLQGAAKVQLGLREEDDDVYATEREVLEADTMNTTVCLREVIYEALSPARASTQVDLSALYDEVLLPRAPMKGRLPSGLFLETNRQQHIKTLEQWRDNLAHLNVEPPLVRQSVGMHDASVSPLRELPLSFELELDHGSVIEPVIVEIRGVLDPSLANGGAYVTFATGLRTSPSGAKRIRYFLRGFTSWMLAAAVGRQHPEQVRLVLVTTKDHSGSGDEVLQRFTQTYGSVSQDEARAYLRQLSRQLLEESHDYLLPAEFVCRLFEEEGVDPVDERLERLIAGDLEKLDHRVGSYRHGPIKDYARFGPPGDSDLRRILATRFPHLYRSDR